jgi:hypothetical protein
MDVQQWVVKKPGGEEWGLIKRLIIDSSTRQISYADVSLVESGGVVRVPWENFEVRHELITLTIPEGQVTESMLRASSMRLSDTVTMDVWR